MVKSSAIERDGADLRDELAVVPVLALQPDEREPRDHPSDEGDAEVDEDALGDLADGDVHRHALQAEPGRENRDEDVGVDREEEHLEDRVEGDQAGAVFGVALGQVVPDDDHGDAAGEADHDEPDHVLGLVAQEEHGQAEHQDRANDPVLHERQPEDLGVAEDRAHLLVADLGQRRVHHQDEADGDGNVGRPDVESVDQRDDSRDQVSAADADRHGDEDPEREIAVEKGQALGHALCTRDGPRCQLLAHH